MAPNRSSREEGCDSVLAISVSVVLSRVGEG